MGLNVLPFGPSVWGVWSGSSFQARSDLNLRSSVVGLRSWVLVFDLGVMGHGSSGDGQDTSSSSTDCQIWRVITIIALEAGDTPAGPAVLRHPPKRLALSQAGHRPSEPLAGSSHCGALNHIAISRLVSNLTRPAQLPDTARDIETRNLPVVVLATYTATVAVRCDSECLTFLCSRDSRLGPSPCIIM